jgi:hypothetical protein
VQISTDAQGMCAAGLRREYFGHDERVKYLSRAAPASDAGPLERCGQIIRRKIDLKNTAPTGNPRCVGRMQDQRAISPDVARRGHAVMQSATRDGGHDSGDRDKTKAMRPARDAKRRVPHRTDRGGAEV